MLIDTLRADMIAAMKAKESVKKNILKLIISESTSKSKNPSDEEVFAAIKASNKNNTTTLKDFPDNEDAKKEIEILTEYLPTKLTGNGLLDLFNEFIESNPLNKEKLDAYKDGDNKSFGFLMGNMVKYAEGKADSVEIKKLIQSQINS